MSAAPQQHSQRDLNREKREGVSAYRGILLGLAVSIPAWVAIIVLLVWLL